MIVASLLFASSHVNYDEEPLINPLSDATANGSEIGGETKHSAVLGSWNNTTERQCPAHLTFKQVQCLCREPGVLRVQVFCHLVRRKTSRVSYFLINFHS